jgi:hypothetical protein
MTLFALLFSSCSLFEQASPDLIINIDEDILLDMREHLGIDGNGFYLNMTSQDSFECAGLEYDYQFNRQGQAFYLQIKGLKNPSSCNGENHYVTNDLFITAENGSYAVHLDIGPEITNQGVLTIEDDHVNLSFKENHGIHVAHEKLLRIPQGTVWGFVSGGEQLETVLSWVHENFVDIGEESDLMAGYYGHFEIPQSDRVLKIIPKPEQTRIETFVFHLNGDESQLRNFVDNFSGNFGESALIEMTSWTGKTYH